MPQGLGSVGGLGALGTVLGMHPEHKPTSGIRGLLAILAKYPGASIDMKQSILGNISSGLAAQQQAHQAAYQNALGSAEQYAMSPTATPTGLEGFMGLAASGLGPNQQANLQAAAPQLGALLPGAGATTDLPPEEAALAPTDVPIITGAVGEAFAAIPADQQSDPTKFTAALQNIVEGIRSQSIAQGKTQAETDAWVALAQHTIDRLLRGGGGAVAASATPSSTMTSAYGPTGRMAIPTPNA